MVPPEMVGHVTFSVSPFSSSSLGLPLSAACRASPSPLSALTCPTGSRRPLPRRPRRPVPPCRSRTDPREKDVLRGDSRVLAFLRRDGRLRGHGLQRVRSGVRDGEERHGHRRHVRDEARAHHEVHHPRGHGRHHRHLRAGGGRADRQQHLRQSLSLQELHVPGRRPERGPERVGGRLRHRHRGRRRRAGHRPAAPALRGHDPDPDLRRGAGSLRPHRGPHPVHKIRVSKNNNNKHKTNKQTSSSIHPFIHSFIHSFHVKSSENN